MANSFEQFRLSLKHDCFSDIEVNNFFPKSKNSIYGIIKRSIAKNEIIHIRRGFYCLSEKYRRKPLNLFEIAQKLYGPSYISFESALSFHGWIPEKTQTIASACIKRSKIYSNKIGIFCYIRIPVKIFYADVEQLSQDKEDFFMAKPWRAIADYVYVHKKEWHGIEPLIKSLRIEEDFLKSTPADELELLDDIFQAKRISRFISGVKKDLNL